MIHITGHLVTDYLWRKCDTLKDYCDGLATTSNQYNGYNLLLGDFRWAKHIRVHACVMCLCP